MKARFVIIGGGPTGLGAALRLTELGITDWLLIDENEEIGGLSCTAETPEGFLFDMGGHVIFSHYEYFDDVMNSVVPPEDWNILQRVSHVWIKDRWVSYPFQNNLHALPIEDKVKCVQGVLNAALIPPVVGFTDRSSLTFDDWILKTMGEGIADLFMRPYNFKVWAYPTKDLASDWLGERVATVDVHKVVENVLRDKGAEGWGPNAVFRFPNSGGTGRIWKALADLLPEENIISGTRVMHIDCTDSIVVESAQGRNGEVDHLSQIFHLDTTNPLQTNIEYEHIISTLPLDILCGMLGEPGKANGLVYSSTHVIGLGLRGSHTLGNKCWMYFPESNCPFYRCTVFSNYGEGNVPQSSAQLPTLRYADGRVPISVQPMEGPYWSLMLEVSESSVKLVDIETIVEEAIRGAVNTQLILPDTEIVSIYHRRLERGYPTPSMSRNGAIDTAMTFVEEHGVKSRGRFGGWKYEVANQDHSMMQGVEAVDAILYGTAEPTFSNPNFVNTTKNTHLRLDTSFLKRS